MRRLALLPFAALAISAFAAENAPRNPFWTPGYEGTRHPISAEPRFRMTAETPAGKISAIESRSADDIARRSKLTPAEREAEDLENQQWARASRRLTFGATMFLDEGSGSAVKAAVVINGLVYALGDLISVDFENSRFTWQVESIATDGKLRLKRIIHRTNGNNK